MANPYLGEIRMFAGNFVPYGWAFCDGQLLPISQNTALFSLLGTFYGGNGTTTFGLPNLQGATPMDQGSGGDLTPRSIGETGGEATVRLSQGQLPSHTHDAIGTTAAASSPSPVGNLWASAVDPSGSLYSDATPPAWSRWRRPPCRPGWFGLAADNNLPPYLAVSFIICLRGVVPFAGLTDRRADAPGCAPRSDRSGRDVDLGDPDAALARDRIQRVGPPRVPRPNAAPRSSTDRWCSVPPRAWASGWRIELPARRRTRNLIPATRRGSSLSLP